MKLYTLYEPSGKVIGCEKHETQPINSTDLLCTENFVTPYFNTETNKFYEGATPEELEEIRKESVPQEITKRQFKTALLILKGIYPEVVEAFIETLPEPDRTFARFGWHDSNGFRRDNEMILNFAYAFGLNTTTDLDELFTYGNSIN